MVSWSPTLVVKCGTVPEAARCRDLCVGPSDKIPPSHPSLLRLNLRRLIAPSPPLSPHPPPPSAPPDEAADAPHKTNRRKAWIHSAFSATGGCRYCGSRIASANSTVKKKHLLNPRTCGYEHEYCVGCENVWDMIRCQCRPTNKHMDVRLCCCTQLCDHSTPVSHTLFSLMTRRYLCARAPHLFHTHACCPTN